jgi:hypothetical protein
MSEEQQSGAGAAAREETARQLVTLAASLVAVPLIVWLQRHSADPDFLRTLRMSASKQAERCCATAAGWLWQRAEQARRAYEQDAA